MDRGWVSMYVKAGPNLGPGSLLYTLYTYTHVLLMMVYYKIFFDFNTIKSYSKSLFDKKKCEISSTNNIVILIK